MGPVLKLLFHFSAPFWPAWLANLGCGTGPVTLYWPALDGARGEPAVLTAYCTDEYIHASLNAGADGYVLKDASRAELMHAVRAVIGGQKYFSEPVSARLVSNYLRRNEPVMAGCPRITERERQVLTRVALGETNKRVAMALRLSIKTIEKHRANLMRKLDLHNTAAVTLFAVRNGMLPMGEAEAAERREGNGR